MSAASMGPGSWSFRYCWVGHITSPDDAALDLKLRTSLVLLRVDDPDAGPGHRQVVDVRPRPRDATVVQDAQNVSGQFGE
jgi:hypothetical protein